MPLLHTITKIVATLPLLTGPLMLAAGLGVVELPPALARANGGSGLDKFMWAEDFYGVPKPHLLSAVGICKILALLDIWLLRIVPQFTLVCVAILMGAVAHGHIAVQDEDQGIPPILLGVAALVAAVTCTRGQEKRD